MQPQFFSLMVNGFAALVAMMLLKFTSHDSSLVYGSLFLFCFIIYLDVWEVVVDDVAIFR